MVGAIAIRTFLIAGIVLVLLSLLLIFLAHRRNWPLWTDSLAGLLAVTGFAAVLLGGRRVTDGPQVYRSFRGAFSSFYGNSWLYPLLYFVIAAAVMVALAAGLRRKRPERGEVLAISIGCLAGAAAIGLLDSSISPF